MTSSSTTPSSITIPENVYKKVLVLIVGEEGVGKSGLLQSLMSLEDPLISSLSNSFFSPSSSFSSSSSNPISFAKASDRSLFTGVKIHPGLGKEGPVWVEFLIVPPRLNLSTRAMLYQGAHGILGVYHVLEARSYELCWKRIGHVCEVLGVSVWHPHLSADPSALPVLMVAMDSANVSPTRSRMTPFETSWSLPSSFAVLNDFLAQVIIQQGIIKRPNSSLSRYPTSPSDMSRRKQTSFFKQRSVAPF